MGLLPAESPFAFQHRLRATFQRLKDVVMVHLEGEMDFYSIQKIQKKVAKVRQAGITRLIFDLSEVQYIDCSGLSFIVGTHRDLQENQGHLVCLRPSSRMVQRVLDSSLLSSVLTLADTPTSALELLQPRGPVGSVTGKTAVTKGARIRH